MKSSLFSMDYTTSRHVRHLVCDEAERLSSYQEKAELVKGLTDFSKQIGEYQNDESLQIDLVEVYCLLFFSDAKEKSKQILHSLWCSFTQTEKEGIYKVIEKKKNQ